MRHLKTTLFAGAVGAALVALIAVGCTSTGQTKSKSGSSTHDPKGWTVPKSAAKKKNPVADNSQSIAKGKDLFDKNCAICHGKNAKGDGPEAPALTPHPANLTAKDVQKQSDGELFYRISNGHKVMPAFKNQLSEDQIWNIINYVHSLGSGS